MSYGKRWVAAYLPTLILFLFLTSCQPTSGKMKSSGWLKEVGTFPTALSAQNKSNNNGWSLAPDLEFSPKEHRIGRALRVSFKITNTGGEDVQGATVKLDFPSQGMRVRRALIFPPMKGDGRNLLESSFYWLNIDIKAGKTKRFIIWAQTSVCEQPSLHFEASLYVKDAQGRPKHIPASVMFGQESKSSYFPLSQRRGKKTCAPTAAPSIAPPDVPFSVYAIGEKCLEGTTVAGGSQVGIQTPEQCWQSCSLDGDGTTLVPFYFNWNVVSKECFCVGQTCKLVYDLDYIVFRIDHPATPVPTMAPTMRPTFVNETYEPTLSPTVIPTQAPTRACSLGEYRDVTTGACIPCAPGTYWNQSFESTSCLNCPQNQTSLQAATRCYTPCPTYAALNTTDLTCVPVPPSLESVIAQGNVSINLNTSDIYLVMLPNKLEDTVARATDASGLNSSDPNAAIVIALAPGLYPVQNVTVLRANVVIVVDYTIRSGGRRRELQGALVDPVIYATSDTRHFIVADGGSLTIDGIIFRGALTGSYSGGIELQGRTSVANFFNTTFQECRWAGNGGALFLSSGSQCSIRTGSKFLANAALAGAGIYLDDGSTLTIYDMVTFANNSAPQISAASGGGGGIYVNNAALTLGSVQLEGNINDDITVKTGTVSCLNSSHTTGCSSSGCTGSYDIPSSCPICDSLAPVGGICSSCPKGTYGGAEAELSCQLCPYGKTTYYPPSSLTSADCTPITQSPTTSPTRTPTQQPSTRPSGVPTHTPTRKPTLAPTTPFPLVRVVNVTTLNTDPLPPADVWATNPGSYNALQALSPTPSPPYACALRQETHNNPSKATAGIYWEQFGLFNGMLFKSFVLSGFQLRYNYYVQQTPAGNETIFAPDLRIQTRSPLTGRYSDFIFNPYYNQASQGPVTYQSWKDNVINETTGSSGSWPVGTVGGSGWSCTLGCYMPTNSTGNLAYPPAVAAATFRNLETYVQGLLDQDENSVPYISINDAIIVGIQIVLGPEEPNSISFTHDVAVQSTPYSWAWMISC